MHRDWGVSSAIYRTSGYGVSSYIEVTGIHIHAGTGAPKACNDPMATAPEHVSSVDARAAIHVAPATYAGIVERAGTGTVASCTQADQGVKRPRATSTGQSNDYSLIKRTRQNPMSEPMVDIDPPRQPEPQRGADLDVPPLAPATNIDMPAPLEWTTDVDRLLSEPVTDSDLPPTEPDTPPEPASSIDLLPSKLPTSTDLLPISETPTTTKSADPHGSEVDVHAQERPDDQREGWSIDPNLWATYLAALSPSMLSDDDSYRTNSSGTDATGDSESSDVDSPPLGHDVPKKTPSLGGSRSATARRKLIDSMHDGTFRVNEAKLANFEHKVLQVNANADFDLSLPTWRVFHPPCGKWVSLPEAYNVSRYRLHDKKCKGTARSMTPVPRSSETKGAPGAVAPRVRSARSTHANPAVSSRTLNSFMKQSGQKKQGETEVEVRVGNKESVTRDVRRTSPVLPKRPPLRCSLPVPCAGITEQHAPGVTVYLQRTGAQGGGSRSVQKIAHERYGRPYAALEFAERQVVNRQQQHERTWHNRHAIPAVFSVKCEQTIPVEHGHVPAHPICPPCLSIARSKRFKTALRVPMPAPKHYKHLNYQYRNETLGHLYARSVGLQELVESGVSGTA